MSKNILIIGGGLTGMSAGIFGRLNGFDTRVVEAHTRTGGVCTGWTRKGYTFDGCFHWWIGSAPDSPFHPLFEKIGIFPDTRPIRHELFTQIRLNGKKPFNVWNSIDRLKQEMLNLAPEDEGEIDRFFKLVRLAGSFRMPMEKPMEAMGIRDWIALGKSAGRAGQQAQKLMKISLGDYARRFKSAELREVLVRILPADSPVFTLMMFLDMFDKGDGTFPEGGAPLFMERVEKRYTELGGELLLGKRVKRILVEKNRACGAELEDGTVYRADHVISAADGHTTLFGLLGGQYLNGKLKRLYSTGEIFTPLVMVFFGVAADLSPHPHSIGLEIHDEAAGIPVHGLGLKHYGFDPTLSPAGKTVGCVMMESPWDTWEKLKAAGEPYTRAKEAFAELARKHFTAVYPEAEGKIEVTDVSTPYTFVRYTSAWKGSYEGWYPSVKNLSTRIPKILPGLKNFRMAGQWVEPGGGIPSAVKSGYDAIWMIAHGR